MPICCQFNGNKPVNFDGAPYIKCNCYVDEKVLPALFNIAKRYCFDECPSCPLSLPKYFIQKCLVLFMHHCCIYNKGTPRLSIKF